MIPQSIPEKLILAGFIVLFTQENNSPVSVTFSCLSRQTGTLLSLTEAGDVGHCSALQEMFYYPEDLSENLQQVDNWFMWCSANITVIKSTCDREREGNSHQRDSWIYCSVVYLSLNARQLNDCSYTCTQYHIIIKEIVYLYHTLPRLSQPPNCTSHYSSAIDINQFSRLRPYLHSIID